ncbi:MAG TPA: carboxypeptidase-like regulatory domain-containing protein, partial [Bryobacteraceae bacterium]|nr:carboxypeptidase-like regulatory domain-containing protein [Bryobacteraceae bacterium]
MFRLMWLFLAGMAALFAQVDTGAISGIVRDASSAVIAGTRVQIINEATNIQLNLVTNSSGFYSAQALKPGQYSVTVSRDGFTTEKRAHLELHVQERLEVNFDLKINASNTEVTVLAESPLLESESSSVGNVVQSKTIQELPLNGR